MTTEQNIREAFDEYNEFWAAESCSYQDFRAGYMALLVGLKRIGSHKVECAALYMLPEGVEK